MMMTRFFSKSSERASTLDSVRGRPGITGRASQNTTQEGYRTSIGAETPPPLSVAIVD